MGFDTGNNRDELWPKLPQAVRAKLEQRAGRSLEWYARIDSSDPGRRPYAVLIGDQALCVALPRLSTEHKPVYALSVYELTGFRHKDVVHRPRPSAGRGPASAPPGPSGPPSTPTLKGLSDDARGVLGNLPAEAQELLQTPFVNGQEILRCTWYYHGWDHHLEVFVLILAGARDVTMVTGNKIVPAGHADEDAHWTLRCHRATVVRRQGR